MIHIELLPFTNKQTRTIKYTCDRLHVHGSVLPSLYPLSNLKLYLILVFVMFFYCSIKALANQDTKKVSDFFQKHFCVRNKCFPVCAAQETSWATMRPQQCVLVYQGLYKCKNAKTIRLNLSSILSRFNFSKFRVKLLSVDNIA